MQIYPMDLTSPLCDRSKIVFTTFTKAPWSATLITFDRCSLSRRSSEVLEKEVQRTIPFDLMETLRPTGITFSNASTPREPPILSNLHSVLTRPINLDSNHDEEPPSETNFWESVLTISHKYEFASMTRKAVQSLLKIAPESDKLRIGHYFRSRELLIRGYREFCFRELPVGLDEGRLLGVDDVTLISRAREALRHNQSAVVGANLNYGAWTETMFKSRLEDSLSYLSGDREKECVVGTNCYRLAISFQYALYDDNNVVINNV